MTSSPAEREQDAGVAAPHLDLLVAAIAIQIEQARSQVRQAVNSAMVASYWQIGRLIVEHEQQGHSRAAYGTQQFTAAFAATDRATGQGL